MKALPFSQAGDDSIVVIASASSGAPTDIHQVADGYTDTITLYARNVDTGVQSLFLRIDDGTNQTDYRQYDFEAGEAGSTWSILVVEIPHKADGDNHMLEGYSSQANVIQVMGRVIRTNN